MPSPEMTPVFAATQLKLDPEEYCIVSLPVEKQEEAMIQLKNLPPFTSITVVEEEVSLILKTRDWAEISPDFPNYKVEGPYAFITFDIILDLSLVGFLSVVSAVLADEKISIYAISTYLKDHILIKKEDQEKAVEVLEQLIERCKNA